jgi:prepilin-type N-terminal cleavage/methylation domain-containing protein
MVKKRGFTLLELIVAMGILGLLIIALFEVFDFGSKAFREANIRQNAQGAMTRAYSVLRGELRRSHFRSISVVERATNVDDVEVRRDALSLGGLKDWHDPANYDELNGVPKWNRFILFYGTMDGKLVRTTVDLDNGDPSPVPFFDLDPERYLKDDPSINTGYQTGYRVISDSLEEFACTLYPGTDTVRVQCTLVQDRYRREKSLSQFELEVFPQNTWPKGDS